MKHDWVALAAFSVTEEEVEQGIEGAQVNLTMDKLHPKLAIQVGCVRCEQPFKRDAGDCPGDPVAYKRDGDPLYEEPT